MLRARVDGSEQQLYLLASSLISALQHPRRSCRCIHRGWLSFPGCHHTSRADDRSILSTSRSPLVQIPDEHQPSERDVLVMRNGLGCSCAKQRGHTLLVLLEPRLAFAQESYQSKLVAVEVLLGESLHHLQTE